MRLSDRVNLEDVERTIAITMSSLKQVGTDPQTGNLDIDILTVGVGKSQRERIKDLKNIIMELAKEYGSGGVPLDKIVEKAAEHGVTKDKVEKEIKKLKEIGEIFEPKVGFFSHT
jgi:replicative DNA helicase Mcm